MLSLFGIGVGRGIAIGQAYVLKSQDIEVPHHSIQPDEVEAELARFEAAINDAEKQYHTIRDQLDDDAPPESAAFINAHLLMLRDSLFVDESKNIIKTELVNAEYALTIQSNNLIKVFEAMQDNYLRNKKADVKQITNRILRTLLNLTSHSLDEFNDEDLSKRIIVGKDLSPADTIYIKNRKVSAFITDFGSQISHTSIVARSLKLPAVVGLHGNTKYIQENDMLIVDGKRGIIIVNPSEDVLKEYRKIERKIKEREKQLNLLTNNASKSLDGEKIHLFANIESSRDIKAVNQVNAAGVGLYRTEYLFMNRDTAPTEQEQFRAYKRIVTQLKKPLTIRTLDIGGDKQLGFDYPQKPSSQSPLGLRGLRLCLNNTGLFIPQLRAILRASAFGKISIMIPMMSNFDEINQVIALIKQTKIDLREKGVAFDNRIKVGGMIEVPAAAILADQFAHKLDFLSIGTNDLIQYTLAIDRVDDAVNYLYDPIHPAVLQLIKQIISAGNKANIPVSLCGEMAGDANYTRLLLGLGLRRFSMDASYVLDVKSRILKTDIKQLKSPVRKITSAGDASLARVLLSRLNASESGSLK